MDEYEFYEVSYTKHLFRSRSISSPYELVLHVVHVYVVFFFFFFFFFLFFFSCFFFLVFFFDAACFNCFRVLIFQMQKVENGDFNWIIPGVCHQMNLCGVVWGSVISLSSNECECES